MYSKPQVAFHLSSNCKVLQFLEQSNKNPLPQDFLCPRAPRTRCDSDEDSLGRSDCSPTSSQESSNASFTEELDFNLAFDTESDSRIDDLDTLLSERITEFDDFVRQSSHDTLTGSPQRSRSFLDDAIFTSDSESLRGIIRSNSLSIVPWNGDDRCLLANASKKAVRFADMLGLDLESVRYMTPPDSSSMLLNDFRHTPTELTPIVCTRGLSTYFPVSHQYNLVSRNFVSPTDILPLIYQKQILLECLYTKESTAYGTIRVHNLAYEKRVFVRVTEDEWITHRDIQAWHSMNQASDNTDAFTFQICLDKTSEDVAERPKRLLFALCLQAMSQDYWDNNQNANYVLDVFERR